MRERSLAALGFTIALLTIGGGCSPVVRLRSQIADVRRSTSSTDPTTRVLVFFVGDKPPNEGLRALDDPELFYAATHKAVTVIVARNRLRILHKDETREVMLSEGVYANYGIGGFEGFSVEDWERRQLYMHLTGQHYVQHETIVMSDLDLNPIRELSPGWFGHMGVATAIREIAPIQRHEYELWRMRQQEAGKGQPRLPEDAFRGFVYQSTPPRSQVPSGPFYGSVYYVAVGINNYPHGDASLKSLSKAEGDATAIAARFDELGWKRVSLLVGKDGTKQLVREAVGSLAEAASSDDAVVFYFAGHGKSVDTAEGPQGLIMPVDADPKRPRATAISIPEIAGLLQTTRAKHVLLILDCCTAGLAVDIPRGPDQSSSPDYTTLLQKPAKVAVVAGTGNQSAYEPKDQAHSYFTQGVLDALTNRTGEDWAKCKVFTSSALGAYLQRLVTTRTSGLQTPSCLQLPGHGGGDFVFDLR